MAIDGLKYYDFPPTTEYEDEEIKVYTLRAYKKLADKFEEACKHFHTTPTKVFRTAMVDLVKKMEAEEKVFGESAFKMREMLTMPLKKQQKALLELEPNERIEFMKLQNDYLAKHPKS